MRTEQNGNAEEAAKLFRRAWNEATEDVEKFIASALVARIRKEPAGRIKWPEAALQLALRLNDDAVMAAILLLYAALAESYRVAFTVRKRIPRWPLRPLEH